MDHVDTLETIGHKQIRYNNTEHQKDRTHQRGVMNTCAREG
jgi:hypothetical protein